MKSFFRSLVPEAWQVPVKYWINGWRNQLEPEIAILKYLVYRGERAIDIGGNRGVYTYALAREGALVDVFEPNPKCANVLAAWAAGNPAITVHRVALSNRTGTAALHIPIDDAGHEHDASASIGKQNIGATRDETVAIETLDSFRFDAISFVKMDVEGHEYDSLRGGEATFRAQRPAILVEIEQRHNERPISEIFDLIASWSYKGYFLTNGRLSDLKNFDVKRDQSMANFDSGRDEYINNFLFLGKQKLEEGRYAALFRAFG